MQSATADSKVSFGVYEADLKTGELRKSGIRIRIQGQPFRVLAVLLEHPGEVVTREELQQRLWGSGTTVDFDHSLGTAINKIREALGDSADNPRFIETLAKRGYRFIAPVRSSTVPISSESAGAATLESPVIHGPSAPHMESTTGQSAWSHHRRQIGSVVAAAACVLLVGGGVLMWFRSTPPVVPLKMSQVTYSGRLSPGEPFLESLPGTATDGSRVYFLQIDGGRATLSQALIVDGESHDLQLPSEIAAPSLGDISPDGSKLLIRNHLTPDAEQSLWIVPTLGGAARRLSSALAHDGTWMPDGQRILYATGTDLFVAKEDGTEIRKFATLPGRAFWLRWSPDGSRLRVTLLNKQNHVTSLWEISADGKEIHQLFAGWNDPATECCGNWTADGKYYVFQSTRMGMTSIWGTSEKASFVGGRGAPWQITDGPLSYQAPITARSGHRVFVMGVDPRYELLQYDAVRKQFMPYGKNLAGVGRTQFSRDGEWVAWIRPGDGSLWCSRADGTERLQLTASPMQVFLMKWSPDNKQLAFMGREPGKPWKIYLTSAAGGSAQILDHDARNEADPDWSPDGNLLVFGRLPELMAESSEPKDIRIMDLQTKQVTTLADSTGLFSPRWSPDGRYIAAMPLDQQKLLLYDTEAHTWRTLVTKGVTDPVWSRDGKWLYFHNFLEANQPIYRVFVADGHLELVAGLADLKTVNAIDYSFSGLAPGDIPLVRARMWTANMYSIDLDHR